MSKTKSNALPTWVNNLRRLMDEQGLNPRSLSLKAGLNATAVRDMLEGRSRFPRYDTTQALAEALGTTPAFLMGEVPSNRGGATEFVDADDLNLLTEIITRLQEVATELDRTLSPRDFAAMATTIYKRMHDNGEHKNTMKMLRPQIHDLLDYELLRQKRSRR